MLNLSWRTVCRVPCALLRTPMGLRSAHRYNWRASFRKISDDGSCENDAEAAESSDFNCDSNDSDGAIVPKDEGPKEIVIPPGNPDIHNAFEAPCFLTPDDFREFSSQDEVLGPCANKNALYKNPEYFAYGRLSFYALQVAVVQQKKKAEQKAVEEEEAATKLVHEQNRQEKIFKEKSILQDMKRSREKAVAEKIDVLRKEQRRVCAARAVKAAKEAAEEAAALAAKKEAKAKEESEKSAAILRAQEHNRATRAAQEAKEAALKALREEEVKKAKIAAESQRRAAQQREKQKREREKAQSVAANQEILKIMNCAKDLAEKACKEFEDAKKVLKQAQEKAVNCGDDKTVKKTLQKAKMLAKIAEKKANEAIAKVDAILKEAAELKAMETAAECERQAREKDAEEARKQRLKNEAEEEAQRVAQAAEQAKIAEEKAKKERAARAASEAAEKEVREAAERAARAAKEAADKATCKAEEAKSNAEKVAKEMAECVKSGEEVKQPETDKSQSTPDKPPERIAVAAALETVKTRAELEKQKEEDKECSEHLAAEALQHAINMCDRCVSTAKEICEDETDRKAETNSAEQNLNDTYYALNISFDDDPKDTSKNK